MPEFVPSLPLPDRIDDFLKGYLHAIEWLLPEDDPKPTGFSPELIERAQRDCEDFKSRAGGLLDAYRAELTPMAGYTVDECAGHDFWLTRNGHGAGFWDRGFDKLGDDLTKVAKQFHEISAYTGDDGLVYIG